MENHLTDWVADNARRHGSSVVVDSLDTGDSVTWEQLEDRVSRLAAVLRSHGTAAGDRVGLIADDDWRTLALQFACIRIGAIFTPFNWRLARGEIEVLCKDAEVGLLVHDDTWQETAQWLGDNLGVRLASWAVPGAAHDIDTAMAIAVPVAAPADGYAPDQVIQMLYTSGTTGLPKGALITLGGIDWHSKNVHDEMVIAGPPARYLSALPLFHAAGLNAIVNPTLRAGGRISIQRRFDPVAAAGLLGDPTQGFTNFNAAPVMYRMIMEAASPEATFGHINAGMVGGGAIPSDVGDFFSSRGLELQGGWGATEMGPSMTLVEKHRRVDKSHTVGKLVEHVEIRVVDPATNQDVAPGEVGEAWVRGPSISPGYWRREPDNDADTRAGWFKCGDAVSIDDDGYVTLRGRFKDMYKSGGENVFAAEVERVLVSHPDVQDAAVIGVPDERWGEVGHAVVVPETGRAVDGEALIAHVAERLAKYKVPTRVIVLDELPRNVTGKVQKNLLRESLV